MSMMDQVLEKCKNHNRFSNEEFDYVFKKLNEIYGDITDKDYDVPNEYPMNLIRIIQGTDEIFMTDPKTIEKIEKNLEYVYDNTGLTQNEASVIRLRLKKHLSLDETAKILDVTKERIRQIEAKAIRKLKVPKRKDLIFVPHKLYDEVMTKVESYEKRNRELSNQISKTIERIEYLSKALEGVDVKATVEVEEYHLSKPISELNLSIRSYNACKRSGINTVADLTAKTEKSMLEIRCLGQKGLIEIKNALLNLGLDFKKEDDI